MQHSMFLLVVLLLLTLSSPLSCPSSSPSSPLFQSGLITAYPAKGVAKRLYTVKFGDVYAGVPAVCIGISGYQDRNPAYLKIRSYADKITESSFTLNIAYPLQSQWSSFSIHHISTTHPSIQLGTSYIQSRTPMSSRITLKYSPRFDVNRQTKIRHFLTGIDAQADTISSGSDLMLGVQFQKMEIKGGDCYFYFGSGVGLRVLLVEIAVVLVDTNDVGLVAIEGIIEGVQTGKSSSWEAGITRGTIDELGVYVVGFSSIAAIGRNGFKFSCEFTSKFGLLIDSNSIDSIQFNYFAVSTINCGNCQDYPYMQSNLCIKKCPSGTTPYFNICVPSTCQSISSSRCTPACPQNMYFSGKTCVCLQGYYLIGGRCQTCPIGSLYSYLSRKCERICRDGEVYVVEQDACISKCGDGLVYDYGVRGCVGKCDQGWTWDGSDCICNTPGCTVYCPPPSYYNPTTRSCGCPANMLWTGQQCICPSDYTYYNGYCTKKCRPTEDFINGACQCKPGYYGNSCIPCPSGQTYSYELGYCVDGCPANRVLVGRDCLCPEGFWDSGVACYPCSPNVPNSACCPYGQVYNPVTRTCSPNVPCANGKIWDGQKCVCPPGTIDVPLFNTCRGICPADKILSPSGECVCRDGTIENWYGVCQSPVTCDPGYDLINGKCVKKCGEGEIWSGTNCVCKPGYERQTEGYCIFGCTINEERISGVCQCKSGFIRIDNKCTPPPNFCPAPHYFNGITCICAAGFQKDQTGACVPTCNQGYIKNEQGICVPGCGAEQILIQGKCVCRVGTYNVNGYCSYCPKYSYSVGGVCYCQLNNAPLARGNSCPVYSG